MSFLTDYEYDIFISYTHIDNRAPQEQRGWIDKFHEDLEMKLQVHLGAKPAIWRDPRLAGNVIFEDELVEKIPKVVILVSVLSPSYVNSEWCRREMRLFCESADQTGGIGLGNKSRIFKVERIHVPLQRHPPELQRMTGYEFYHLDEQAQRAHEFLPNSVEYWTRIEDVAQDMARLLETMKQRSEEVSVVGFAAASAGSAASGETIYLAETSLDLSPQRDGIKRELQQRGHTVVPDRPLPLNGPQLQAAVREYLQPSKLSIHLIGANYGVIPEAADRSVVWLQNEVAAERSKSNSFSRLIWMPERLEGIEDRQRQFIDYLKNDPAAQQGADLLQTSIEELKTYIQDKLRRAPKPVPSGSNGDKDPLRIYLICDKQDYEAITPLADCFFNQGLEVILPLMEGDEAEVREEHKQSLLECDAVIIFYGNASEGWLRTKLRDVQKSPGYGRTKPMLAEGVYVGAPETTAKQRYRTHEALVMKDFGAFSPDKLQPFIDEINKAEKGNKQ